jgi:hypothetical protein
MINKNCTNHYMRSIILHKKNIDALLSQTNKGKGS